MVIMYRGTCLAFVFGIFFALVQTGHTLQCWKCSSMHDVTCRDHFNLTRLEQIKMQLENSNYGNRNIIPARTDPHLEPCDEKFATSNYYQKNVCVKIVYKGPHGIPEVERGCRLVKTTHTSENCPEDMLDGNRKPPQFCGVCEKEGCNAAGAVKNNLLLVAALPVLLASFLRK